MWFQVARCVGSVLLLSDTEYTAVRCNEVYLLRSVIAIYHALYINIMNGINNDNKGLY